MNVSDRACQNVTTNGGMSMEKEIKNEGLGFSHVLEAVTHSSVPTPFILALTSASMITG